ncbi:MAG: carbohydrate ABC transporter permease [Oscillospiraceae bacterium]
MPANNKLNANQRPPSPEGEGGLSIAKNRIVEAFRSVFLADGKGPGIYFVLPSLLGVLVFVLLPFLDVVRRSFSTTMGGENVGFANYRTIFTNEAFLLAASNTLKFMAVCLPLLLSLSLGLALILYAIGEKAGIFKTAFLIPMAIPVASIVLLWKVLFANQGLANNWIVGLGGTPISWMDSDSAFWVLVGSYLWKNIGYDVVLWLAGLAGINESLFEAAKVDGAGKFRTFWQITLPNLLPSLYTILVLSLINAFKVFREAYLVAGDYPHSSIYLLQHLFNNWFRDLSMDKLSAAAVVTALAILILILALRRAFEEED